MTLRSVRAHGLPLVAWALAATALAGCRVVTGIFETGIGVGVVAVLVLVAVVGGAVAMLKR